MNEKKLWLRLFHGRKKQKEQLNDWGADGPIFEIQNWFHMVYAMTINFETKDSWECDLDITRDGLIYYDGMYYGDMEIFAATEAVAAQAGTIVKWDDAKARR